MALRAISPTVKKVRGKVVRAISPTVKKVEGRQWELYPRLLRRWREGWRKLVWRQGNYIRVWAIVSYSGIIVPTLNLNLSQFLCGAAVGGLDIPAAAPAGKKTFLLLSAHKKERKRCAAQVVILAYRFSSQRNTCCILYKVSLGVAPIYNNNGQNLPKIWSVGQYIFLRYHSILNF